MENKYKVEDFQVGDLFVATTRSEDIICEVMSTSEDDDWPLYISRGDDLTGTKVFVHGNCIFGHDLGEHWVHISLIGLRIDKSKLMRR